MFAFASRPEPPRRPIGAPGISEEQYERIAARIREARAGSPRASDPRPRTQPTFRLSAITEGTRP